MTIGWVHTIDIDKEVDITFIYTTEIFFGIYIIITVLQQQNGHDVDFFVITMFDCLCITEY